VSTRASILLWSAGSGIVIGLIIDLLLVGAWMVAGTFLPAIAPRNLSRSGLGAVIFALVAIPLAACLIGYLEGRLKIN
jgi:hypothetical protein